MKRLLCALLLSFLFFSAFFPAGIMAQDRKKGWDDLFEEDRHYYGSEKEEKFKINAFFIEKEEWEGHHSTMVFWFFRTTDYPRYQSFRLMPFYYSLSSKVDNRRRYVVPTFFTYHHINGPESMWLTPLFGSINEKRETGGAGKKNDLIWWAPILPLTYHHTSPEGGHRNFLGLLDYSWETEKNEDTLGRFWLTPFFFWSRDRGDEENSYTHILPPLYLRGKSDDGGSYRHILPPLYMTWKNVESYRSDESADGKGISRVKIMREHSYSLLWGWARDREYNDDGTGKITDSSFWFPIIPVFYRSRTGDSYYHYNVLWFLDWGNNGHHSGSRFWVAPVFFGKGGDYGYLHVLPPLYLSGRTGRTAGWFNTIWDETSYRHILPPLFMSGRKAITSPKEIEKSYLHILPPLFMSWYKKTDKSAYGESRSDYFSIDRLYLSLFAGYARSADYRQGVSVSTDYRYFWIPIVPLYYSSYNELETHRNLFWLFDWKTDNQGKLTRFWFIPFIFYNGGDEDETGSKAVLPFYYRTAGSSEESGSSMGLFHYYGWSKNSRTVWSWPWYSSRNSEDDTWYRHFLPVYYSWKQKSSTGSILLPLWVNYETKRRSIHLNASGFSKSMAMGPFSPSLFPAKYHGKWYLDMDFSWLYDVFSISSRVAIDNPFKSKWKDDQDGGDISEAETAGAKETKTGLHVRKSFDRENCESFWGMKLLFGWVAWEQGDTKRHFRLLPLSWLTWDKESDDRIYAIPPVFVYYNSTADALRYLVVFPFYGSQNRGNSYTRAYLLDLFWDEYDDEEKLHEKTILWPLVNWYESPVRRGWRVLPLVWFREKVRDTEITRRYISPLFYHYSIHDKDSAALKYRVSVNPFVYHKKTVSREGDYSTVKLPLIPLVSFSMERNYFYGNVPAAKKGQPAGEVMTGSMEYYRHWFLPLYYYSRNTDISMTEGVEGRKTRLVGLPLMYYSTYTRSEGKEEKKVTQRTSRFFFMGYLRDRDDDTVSNSLFGGLVGNERNSLTGDYSFKVLYGLVRGYGSAGEGGSWMLPVYSYRRDPELRRITALAGLAIHNKYYDNNDRSLYMGWGLASHGLYHENKYVYVDGKSGDVPVTNRRHWLAPLYFHRSIEGQSGDMAYRRTVHVNPLWYSDREHESIGGNGEYYSRFWFPVLPMYYRYSDDDEVHWNALLLIDHTFAKSGTSSRTMLFPLFYTKRDGGGRHNNILGIIDWGRDSSGSLEYSTIIPLYLWVPGSTRTLFLFPLLGWFKRGPGVQESFLLGAYWRTSTYGSRQNLLYLFDHEYVKSSDTHTWDFLMFLARYRTTPAVTHSELLLGLLMDYTNYKNRPDYDFDLGLFLVTATRSGSRFSNGVFPLWYYRTDANSWWFLSIAGLSYLSKDRDGDFDLGLLGLLYYRNNDAQYWRDRRMWLLGTLWHEVKKPERKYHSRGMLWGILWDYETEEETGFKKFTLLKGILYKQTEIKGETRRRFLLIPF